MANVKAVIGTTAEIAKLLTADIAIHRAGMHQALDTALEFLQMVQDAKEDDNGMTPMQPAYDMVSARVGRKLTETECIDLWSTLMEQLLTVGGMSRCHTWELAHSIEHLMQGKTH